IEMNYINNIRNAIPNPTSNSIMQKVMPMSQKDGFFTLSSDGKPKSIGGYMTTAVDSKQFQKYNDIYDGMRLDYSGSEFTSTAATECIVVRFKSLDVDNLYIPRNKNNGGLLNDPLDSSPYNKNLPPFTGNGFTSGKNGTLGVPEWKVDFGKNLRLEDGAEMYKIDSMGNELLIGMYDESKMIFITKI
ncbi:MAG: hypothetical protein LH629_13485, partial [Ignavibacteria bacterium]|nr:hypothetical protein [Ignavibacteria bacterium]